MPKRSLHPGNGDQSKRKIEQLNQAVELMLARNDRKVGKSEAGIEPLLRIAADLRDLPRESFKAGLKSELKGRKIMSTVAEPVVTAAPVASPSLTFKNAAQAIEFYQNAFGAKEIFRFEAGGHIAHAEMTIGDSVIMLAEEWPEGNRFSAETLGNSPVSVVVRVSDVDAFAEHAVAAGAKVIRPLKDQFYGHRDVTFVDPFGYSWTAVTVKEEMSVEEMHRRMKGMTTGPEGGQMPRGDEKGKVPAVNPIPSGYRMVTPYLVAPDANAVIDFVKKTFGGEEIFRAVGSAGGYHCEVRVEDSMLMIGGGGAGVTWKGDAMLGAFHVYVRDCDAAYQRALQAGGKSLTEPADQEYGERTAGVIDAAGNHWYIATFKKTGYKWEGAPTIQPYMHPLRAEPVISFLKRAFGAEEMGRYTAPDGVIHHTTIKVGDSHLEMGEAQGPYQPMKSMFYLYVPDVDAVYRRAVAAGAKSMHEPADQPYGDRVGAVTDVFGNQWWIATHVKDVAH
jgi:PhnB protein